MPWIIKQVGDEYCIFKQGQDGESDGDPLGCHGTEEDAQRQLAALHVSEEDGAAEFDSTPSDVVMEIVSDTMVHEFGTEAPEVPFKPGVSVESLTTNEQGEVVDPHPFFITLPISEVGKVSKNGLIHDEELADSLVRQITEDAAGGIMGHIPPNLRDSAYPISEIHWVGAIRVGKTTWVKGYVPETMPKVRRHYGLLRANGGKAATSIFGKAAREMDDRATGRWRARNFKMEQLDLAPHKRAALPGSGTFAITSEMAGDEDTEDEENTHMKDRDEILAELTADDIRALPGFTAVEEALLAEFQQQANSQQRVTELEEEVTTKTARITELEALIEVKDATIREHQEAAFSTDLDAAIVEMTDWKVKDEKNQQKLASVRALMRKLALAELGDVVEMEKAKETLTALAEGEMKDLLEMTKIALAGGPVANGGKGHGESNDVVELDTSPEAVEDAMSWLGVKTDN